MFATDWTDPFQAHRVVVSEHIPGGRERPLYVDAFSVPRPGDTRTTEAIARTGFGGAPAAIRVVFETAFAILGFELADRDASGHIAGWRMTRSEPDLVEMTVDGPRAAGRIVMRTAGDEVTVTTFLTSRSLLMTAAWAVIAPAHRRVARLLMDRANRA